MAAKSGLDEIVNESVPPVTQRRGPQRQLPLNVSQTGYLGKGDFAKSWTNRKGCQVPQVIAHRGYKAKYPENSLLAFRQAIEVGASGLETDVHLTKDGIVVLNHDGNLRRFGYPKKQIIDCTWKEIEPMRTLAQPVQSMLRLSDLLHFLEEGKSGAWLLLDVKTDNDPDNVMKMTASTIASVSTFRPWNQRILLGLWSARHRTLAAEVLPGFPIVHVGFNLAHSRRHLIDERIGTNMIVQTLLGPGGSRFVQDCKGRAGPNIAWTVNDKDKAEWCARRGMDGIITDDPESLVKILQDFDGTAKEPWMPISLSACLDVVLIFILVNVFFWSFRRAMKIDDGLAPKRSRK